MPMLAVRSVPTESPIVPWTVFDLAFRVDVTERTLLVATGLELGEEEALRHPAQVVFVQELAVVALLAETSKPMLAHHLLVFDDMTEGTEGAHRACSTLVLQAHSTTTLVHSGEGHLSQATLINYHLLKIGQLWRWI